MLTVLTGVNMDSSDNVLLEKHENLVGFNVW
jgi:hypothetical protein